jgi:hypothetical protein
MPWIDYSFKKVKTDDGVDNREAVVIARKYFLDKTERQDYRLGSARVIEDYFSSEYPDYWFISYDSKTLERSHWRYLVVMKKSDGEVIFTSAYVPQKNTGFEWVFEQTPSATE